MLGMKTTSHIVRLSLRVKIWVSILVIYKHVFALFDQFSHRALGSRESVNVSALVLKCCAKEILQTIGILFPFKEKILHKSVDS